MKTPTSEEIRSIFGELYKRPHGYLTFFDHVADNVRWEITGSSALSGVWTSKSEFQKNVWLPIMELIADPGPQLKLVNCEDILKNKDAWVVIELKTVHTRTKMGNNLYNQHYCWHCKFDPAGKITQVRAFIDSSTAEAVLGEEKMRQEATAVTRSHSSEMATSPPEYPAFPFDMDFKSFLNLFYLLTDAPDEHAKYVECFTPDAEVIIGMKTIKGRKDIHAVRISMWDVVKSRRHQPKQVFPLGPRSNVAMIYGVVDYVFKDGSSKAVDWAAKCDLVKLDRVYMSRYQVFLADNMAWKIDSS